MILVAGSVKVRLETLSSALQIAMWMQQETQKETGCLEYRFSQDLEVPNLIYVFERWESSEHLNAHFKTVHMATFNQQLAELLLEKPNVLRYDISQSSNI